MLDGPVTPEDTAKVGLLLTMSESADDATFKATLDTCRSSEKEVPVIGFTGTGGAGKSSLLDELMLRILRDNPGKKVVSCALTRLESEPVAHYLATEFE